MFRLICLREHYEIKSNKDSKSDTNSRNDENYSKEIIKLIDTMRLYSDIDDETANEDVFMDNMINVEIFLTIIIFFSKYLILPSSNKMLLCHILNLLKKVEISEKSQNFLNDKISELKKKFKIWKTEKLNQTIKKDNLIKDTLQLSFNKNSLQPKLSSNNTSVDGAATKFRSILRSRDSSGKDSKINSSLIMTEEKNENDSVFASNKILIH